MELRHFHFRTIPGLPLQTRQELPFQDEVERSVLEPKIPLVYAGAKG